ncbi:Peroxisomal membrane protein [Musa troglodytarum]|uniref:Peroxisomal membrane protein n=1 Tax=Musa troglodytarum TaxID=320322 RepID=A0A9E7L0B7_9LILI|nr:Peroxisomal membrane protein [Musa troglodytarum]
MGVAADAIQPVMVGKHRDKLTGRRSTEHGRGMCVISPVPVIAPLYLASASHSVRLSSLAARSSFPRYPPPPTFAVLIDPESAPDASSLFIVSGALIFFFLLAADWIVFCELGLGGLVLSMGAGASSITGPDGETGGHETGLGDLPESCVAAVLLHLDPPEICRAARLSRTFRGAASADFVWDAKLPENYVHLMELACGGKSPSNRKRRLCLKEIYARLCRPNPLDGGSKEFWLEKNRGGVCMSISSKALLITGIDDRRYWNYILTDESRFHTIAYLQQTWWFEVDGEIDFCFPAGAYSLFFRLHLGRISKRLGRRICSFEHVHGWDIKPVQFQLSTSDGQNATSHCYLDEPGRWILYHAGDFAVENSNVSTKLKFSMTQIDCTHTKGGICVDSVLIYPKGFMQEKAFTSSL